MTFTVRAVERLLPHGGHLKHAGPGIRLHVFCRSQPGIRRYERMWRIWL